VLRRIFGHKRDEVIGGWVKCNDEELHKLNSSPNIIKVMKSRRARKLSSKWHTCERRHMHIK
jgi:hypothetical protein